jgi:Glycosyl hydrolases family 28
LKPRVEFHIAAGASLKTCGDRRTLSKLGALIFAKDALGVAVTGTGTIEGNFRAFFNEMGEGGYKVIEAFLGPYDPLDPPGAADPATGRPRMILLLNCHGARLRDFTIHDAPTWTIHSVGCKDMLIDGITIDNDLLVPNCDGMGIDHCQNVHISNCNISSGDDCIIVRASRNFDQYGDCENVTVSNCCLVSSSAAIKVEPEGAQAVRNVVVSNCVITRSNRGICVSNRDGSLIENVLFSNLVIGTELRAQMWWGAGEPVFVTNQPRNRMMKVGPIRHVHFQNLVCYGENGIFLYGGLESPIEDVTFSNMELTISKASQIEGGFYDLRPGDLNPGVYKHTIAGVYCEQIAELQLEETSVRWGKNLPAYYGPALIANHVSGLRRERFWGSAAHPDHDPDLLIDGKAISNRPRSASGS